MERVKKGVYALLILVVSIVASFVVSSGTANATSGYDGLLKVSPTLFVYTDGSAKTHKMDISATWLAEFKQTYAKRVAQNIGFPTNFVTELEDIMSSGGSWGVFMHETKDGIVVNIVATHDPHAYCGFNGSASTGSYRCTNHAGYDFLSVDYFTHNSYGGGCWGSYELRCSDNGMNIYAMPQFATSTAGGTIVDLPNSTMSDFMFYYMHFNLTYPSGYAGQKIPIRPPPAKYVAMGDSFSSGEGNPPFEAGTDVNNVNGCHRSPQAYPRLIEFDSNLNLSPMAFVACSGAKTSDVLSSGNTNTGQWGEPAQIKALTGTTKVVTITIGGNDVGFKGYATVCLLTSCAPGSLPTLAILSHIADPNFKLKLENVYRTILKKALNAHVYVMNYPFLTDPNGSSGCLGLDVSGAATVQTALNKVISDAVVDVQSEKKTNYRSRLIYVDSNAAGSPFVGKYVCTPGSDFNYGNLPPDDEYNLHPNAQGQRDFATVLAGAIK